MKIRTIVLSSLFLLTLAGLGIANEYYTHGSFPTTGSAATSAGMRAELDLITSGFNNLPPLAGHAGTAVVVNGAGNGLTNTAGQLSLAGNFSLSGAFATTLTVTGATTLTLPAVTDTLVSRTSTDTLTNKTLTSPTISQILNGGTLTLPASTDTLVGRATTDTLTNKTISSPTFSGTSAGSLTSLSLISPIFSTIVNTGTLTLPTSTDTLIGRATTDTLTNKTITSPTIATILNTGTLTLPTSTDTLIGRATTDTLTNKTLSTPIFSGTITGTYTLGGTPTIPGSLTAGTAAVLNPYATSTSVSQAHGLGGTPAFVRTYIECLSAEQGYSVGDRISADGLADVNASLGFSSTVSSTNVSIQTGSSGLVAFPAAGGTAATLTAAKWKVVATPYRLN